MGRALKCENYAQQIGWRLCRRCVENWKKIRIDVLLMVVAGRNSLNAPFFRINRTFSRILCLSSLFLHHAHSERANQQLDIRFIYLFRKWLSFIRQSRLDESRNMDCWSANSIDVVIELERKLMAFRVSFFCLVKESVSFTHRQRGIIFSQYIVVASV